MSSDFSGLDTPATDVPAQDPTTTIPLKLEDWLTVLVMGALALITFANVLARYFSNESAAWTEEIAVFLMIALTLVAASAAVARDRHIRIEYFSDSGSMARRTGLSRFGAVMVAMPSTPTALSRALGSKGLRAVDNEPKLNPTAFVFLPDSSIQGPG